MPGATKKALTPSSSGRGGEGGFRDRSGEVLFIDARNTGYMKDRVLRDFKPEDIRNIANTYQAWKNASPLPEGEGQAGGGYKDIPGFCKSAVLDEIKQHDYVLTPGRYVGAAEEEDDGEPFAEKMARLTAQLKEQFEKSDKLVGGIKNNLARLGFDL